MSTAPSGIFDHNYKQLYPLYLYKDAYDYHVFLICLSTLINYHEETNKIIVEVYAYTESGNTTWWCRRYDGCNVIKEADGSWTTTHGSHLPREVRIKLFDECGGFGRFGGGYVKYINPCGPTVPKQQYIDGVLYNVSNVRGEIPHDLHLIWTGPESATKIAHLLPHARRLTLIIKAPMSFKFFKNLQLDSLSISTNPNIVHELDEEGYLVNMHRLSELSLGWVGQLPSGWSWPVKIDVVTFIFPTQCPSISFFSTGSLSRSYVRQLR